MPRKIDLALADTPHRLADVDREAATATCSTCGPGAVVRFQRTNYNAAYCLEGTRAQSAKKRAILRARSDEEIAAARAKAGGKTCPRCKTWKPHTEISSQRSSPTGFGGYCLPCEAAHIEEWRNKDRAAFNARTRATMQLPINRERARNRRLLDRFGITAAEYDRMYEEQNGLCAMCGKPETRVMKGAEDPHMLCVDHDHETNRVRRLLCAACNALLGIGGDDPLRLIAGALYLRKHGRPGIPGDVAELLATLVMMDARPARTRAG